ncbi:MAG: YihY/virulence factor BrkB family protein [Lachnospiraceae bacterium]|nr:YihY/virulence factor BrkB family protein [Lachnospiraceae bacterium]
MEKIKTLWKKYSGEIRECHISAYASSAAFFMFLSLIPILLLVCSVIPYTPITEADLMEELANLLPASLVPLAVRTVADVYGKSPAVISISALATIWSAGKGMMAITRGLNAIHPVEKPRNFFFQRIRACIYTVILLFLILLSLLVGVFGEAIGHYLMNRVPELSAFMPLFSNLRILVILAVLMLFFTALFTWMPDAKLDFRTQFLGAVFVGLAWSVFSYGFSIYVNRFAGESIYGNMTTIVMLMLWFYISFYLMFLGALLSKFMEPAAEEWLEKKKSMKKKRRLKLS